MTGLITLIASLVALLFSTLHLRCNFDHASAGELARQRFCARLVATGAVIVIVTGPVAALSYAPLHGLDLTLAMAFGAVQAVVLAMQIAIGHHIREAVEAKS